MFNPQFLLIQLNQQLYSKQFHLMCVYDFQCVQLKKQNKIKQLMSHYQKSTPKMRRAFTPRVKSAQNLHHPDIQNSLFFQGKKDQSNNFINPQRMQDPVAKKLNLNYSPQKGGKIDIALMHTDTGSPIKKNNYFSNAQMARPAQNRPAQSRQQGRNIQWPVNNQRAYQVPQGTSTPSNSNNNKFTRCMSAQTIKSAYSSRSEKTDKIKENRKEFNQKFNVAFDYLLRNNTPYLKEKLSMCNQKARPKEESFKIKRPQLFTTNKDFYKLNEDKHRLDIEPQNQKMSLLLSQSKVCGNSTTQEFHNGIKGNRADLAEWSEGFKLQGPICQVTTSHNAFPNHGDFQKMVPIAVWNEHPLGMKHRECSTNSRLMKGEFTPRAQLATWNNLNPIANDLFNPKNGTKYGAEFNKKQQQPIQQWPMPEHKLIVTDGKFSTEMKQSWVDFNSHELNGENKCMCGRKRH